MVFSGKTIDLPENFLPKMLYDFFKANGSVIVFTESNADESCFEYEFEVLGKFFEFNMFKKSEASLFFSLNII